MNYPVLTIIITKNRPVDIQFSVYSLLGEPTDVFVIGHPLPPRLTQDATRMFQMHGQRLTVIEEPVGLTGRNHGLDEAEGLGYPYTFFMDDDNVIPSGYISDLVAHLDQWSDVRAVSGTIQTFAGVKESKYEHWKPHRAGVWPYQHGQRLVQRGAKLWFTERIQVLPHSHYPDHVDVQYFVNSWMQVTEAMKGERFADLGAFGEEIDYTLRLPPRREVRPDLLMYHLAATEGGTRDIKEWGQSQDARQAHWLRLAHRWGYHDVIEVGEFMPEEFL